MPELPDVTVYIRCLRERLRRRIVESVRITSPFVLRSFDPPISAVEGRSIVDISRLGKQIVWELEGGLFVVIHLMIAGRLRWKKRGASVPARRGLAAFDFEAGTLLFTEASPKKRASIHVVGSRSALESFDRGGLEVLEATLPEFEAALGRENHTLKRSLTDPRLFSGIGNAYSDEILHRAQLSPLQHSSKLKPEQVERLYHACRDTLTEWVERLSTEVGAGFPDKVTAFHTGMAVHGRFRSPCPVCHWPVQRIVYAANESNYCPTCQTDGKLLRDRALSRLLRNDWPRTLEELDEMRGGSGREGPSP